MPVAQAALHIGVPCATVLFCGCINCLPRAFPGHAQCSSVTGCCVCVCVCWHGCVFLGLQARQNATRIFGFLTAYVAATCGLMHGVKAAAKWLAWRIPRWVDVFLF